MLLTLKNIVAGYGNITALKGITHLCSRRENRDPYRSERRGKVHHDENHHGTHETLGRGDPFQR